MILLITILLVVFLLAPPWSIVVLIVGCILELIEIVFLRRWSKRIDRKTETTTGAEAMVGKSAVVVKECRPVGSVRIDGELWEARCAGGAAPGDTVVVKSVDSLTLVVG